MPRQKSTLAEKGSNARGTYWLLSIFVLVVALAVGGCLYVSSTPRVPTVHLLMGLIASGKSTLAKELATEHNAAIFSPDRWILFLYGANYSVENFSAVGNKARFLLR